MNLINKIRQNAAQKNKAPATFPYYPTKRSTKGIYMFVSQKNKIIEETYPDGDVLHIEDIFPDGDVLHINTLFKTAGCTV